jgi:hypothetical protein
MKKVLLFIIVLVTNICIANRVENARAEMHVPPRLDLVRIEINNRWEAKDLDDMGVIINQVRDNYCVAEVSPVMISELSRKGYKITTLQENISGIYYDNFFTEGGRGRYLTYTEFVDTMNVMATNNPDICKLETLGMSHQSRLLLAMKISDTVNVDETEPEVYFDGNTHGDEKIGWAICFELIKYILNNYNFNPTVANLVNNREIWIVPMINPDGYVNNVRYNGRAVDLNRNFGWMWGNEDACGSDAFSENEPTAFYNLFVKHPFTIYVTYHAGDSIISYPWSYTTYDSAPEKFLHNYLAQGYSARGNHYPYGQGSIVMYLINGSSKDYTYGFQGEMGSSIEVHNIKTPPATAIDPTFNINRDAMLYYCYKAGQGIQGTVRDSVTGQQLYAQLWVMPRNWMSYTSPTNGDFHRFYLPGTYSLVVRCPGYKDDTVLVNVPSIGDSTVTVNVAMVPDSTIIDNYGMRVVSTRYVTISSNRTYPVRALGVHDNIGYQVDNTKWIVVAMAKPIQNDSGNDFTVYRSSASGSATVKISNNWKGPWTTIGTANAAQTTFDLTSVSFDTARYVRLDATSAFGLDAIESHYFMPDIENNESYWNWRNYDLKLRSNLVRSRLQMGASSDLKQNLTLSIYDATGRNLRTLLLLKGHSNFDYDLRNNQGEYLKSGIYFIRAEGIEKPLARFTVVR